MRNDPRRMLTRGVAEAVEQTPAFISSMEGNGGIPASWGDLASRLVEADIVEASPEAVCEFLCIDRDQLADPKLVVGLGEYAVESFENHISVAEEVRFRAEQGPKAQIFASYFNEATERWKIDNGKERFDVGFEEYQDSTSRFDQATFSNQYDEDIALQALQIKKTELQAYRSGYAVSLDEFVATALSCPDEHFFSGEILTATVDKFLECLDIDHPEAIKLKDVVIGRDDIQVFNSMLRGAFESHYRKIIKEKVRLVEPFLLAEYWRDHFLFAGTEK